MPSRRCSHPTCAEIIPAGSHCPTHGSPRAATHRHYDQHRRDRDAARFYHSPAWRRARAAKLARHPVCQRCRAKLAQHVHHVIPLRECSPAERVAADNLLAVCPPCHSTIEAEAKASNPS